MFNLRKYGKLMIGPKCYDIIFQFKLFSVLNYLILLIKNI